MSELVVAGQIAPMDGDVPADPRRGRVWIRDDAIVGGDHRLQAGRRVQPCARGRRR